VHRVDCAIAEVIVEACPALVKSDECEEPRCIVQGASEKEKRGETEAYCGRTWQWMQQRDQGLNLDSERGALSLMRRPIVARH